MIDLTDLALTAIVVIDAVRAVFCSRVAHGSICSAILIGDAGFGSETRSVDAAAIGPRTVRRIFTGDTDALNHMR